MDPILGCMKASEKGTRRLSDPKWAVSGSLSFANAGLLVQTVEVPGQNGVMYKNDFAWILTPDGAAKVNVTGVPRNSESYLNQTLYLPLRKKIVRDGDTEKKGEVVVAYTPGSNPKPSSNEIDAKMRQMNDFEEGPDSNLFPDLERKESFKSQKRGDLGLKVELKRIDPDTRKEILDELKKRFEEFSRQSDRDQLAFAPQHPELQSRSNDMRARQESLSNEEDRLRKEFLYGPTGTKENLEIHARNSKVYDELEEKIRKSKHQLWDDMEKLREDKKKVVSDLLKTQTLKDFIQGLRGCKSALDRGKWNQDEEFKSFHQAVEDNLQYLENLERRGRRGQTPSGQKSGAGSANGAGQAQ
jgi:hypothetical protein